MQVNRNMSLQTQDKDWTVSNQNIKLSTKGGFDY